MSIDALTEKFNSQHAEEDKRKESAEKARDLLNRTFERIPNSRDERGTPTTCNGPEFDLESGTRVLVGQTNHLNGPGHTYNISIRDDRGVIRGYAQLRYNDRSIMYWAPNDYDRAPGSPEQDEEVLAILTQAEQHQ